MVRSLVLGIGGVGRCLKDLGVEMGVQIDEACCDDQTIGQNLLVPIAVDLAYRGDTIAVNGDVP